MERLFWLVLLLLSVGSQAIANQPIIPHESNRDTSRKAYVSACMIFKNEERFLLEWLEYHKAIGITHFYLYDNASTDNYLEFLLPYIREGEVELFFVKEPSATVKIHNALQRACYNHAVKLSKKHSEWLAIIDSDEFICITNQKSLPVFLKDYMSAPGLVINWVMYGSSNIDELGKSDLQIDKFVYRAPDAWKENFMFKTIVRPKYVKEANIHISSYHDHLAAVYANHNKFTHRPTFKTPPIEKIRINHYWWRDEKYFQEVKRPRRLEWLSNYSNKEVDEKRATYNMVYDPVMAPMVEIVREKVLSKRAIPQDK